MLGNIVYETLEELSKRKGLDQIQNIFSILISELEDYLELDPLFQEIIVKLNEKKKFLKGKTISILDYGVERIARNKKLIIYIENYKNSRILPFILFREACYSFIPIEASELVKICINQIVENNLSRLSASKDWKNLIRDNLVDRDFIYSQFDKLQKFFKIEAKEPLESSTRFFFKEMRENIVLSKNNNVVRFYDIIFERYTYKTSRSLFSSDMIETLRIMIQIFYENKSYLNLSDYLPQFKKFKEEKKIDSSLSLRKFTENTQWINNCTSIAPSYDVYFDAIDLYIIIGSIKFNPLLEKDKIKIVMEEWPFYHSPKFSENCFTTELFMYFNVPSVYLNDFLNYFDKLEEFGYIINKEFYHVSSKTSIINLNYFTDISNVKKIIDPNNVKYRSKYEIETITKYPSSPYQTSLSLFDFIIINRVRNLSVTGLTFDKRIETLNEIKEDVENELRKQVNFNRQFKESLDKLIKYKEQFLLFLEKNEKKGFLYLYSQMDKILKYINLIRIFLNDHPEISNLPQLQTLLNTEILSQTIEEQLYIRNKDLKKIVFRDFLTIYFQSINLFKEEVEKAQIFYNVLNACNNFRILDLKKIKTIVKKSNLAEEIYMKREKRYENVFKSISLYKITNEKIQSTIEALLKHDPPVLKPLLINTILTSPFAKYYPELILIDTHEVYEGLKRLKLYFPRIFIIKTTDLITKRNLICVETYFINIKEKGLFLSILYSYFNNSIIKIKRYFWRGVRRRLKLEPREFYDFENRKFFYSEDFFKQLLIYSQKIFGEKLEWPKHVLKNNVQELFWSKKKTMDNLINAVRDRSSRQEIDFNLKELEDLSEFRKNIEANLINHIQFLDVKAKKFFQRYITSIKFLPAFHKFGFSQYYLYFRPFYYKSPTFEVDYRLLFINSFQTIKYPACIEPTPVVFSEYIFPFRNPNKSYLNWLVKAKKNVSEYCLFFKKKFYEVIHFNRNLTKEGWTYTSLRFKSYMQDVLFNPDYDLKISGIREFDISEISSPAIYGYSTKEFEVLTNIYNTQSIDIKSFLGTKRYSKISNITELLKKKLIFPYISLKNLDFQEKVSIILPDIKQVFNEKIIKIFSFFNVCRIYEIEGELFIYGFQQERTFENGLLIEIWFPKCELDEFFNLFDLLFHYLEIKHYVILTDLVNGKTLLKSVYGNLDFLKDYNPLLNLEWNDKDKIWMNHKLFNEKFEPIYPDLIKKDKQ